jgi:hypothetical protein
MAGRPSSPSSLVGMSSYVITVPADHVCHIPGPCSPNLCSCAGSGQGQECVQGHAQWRLWRGLGPQRALRRYPWDCGVRLKFLTLAAKPGPVPRAARPLVPSLWAVLVLANSAAAARLVVVVLRTLPEDQAPPTVTQLLVAAGISCLASPACSCPCDLLDRFRSSNAVRQGVGLARA